MLAINCPAKLTGARSPYPTVVKFVHPLNFPRVRSRLVNSHLQTHSQNKVVPAN